MQGGITYLVLRDKRRKDFTVYLTEGCCKSSTDFNKPGRNNMKQKYGFSACH